MLAHYLMNRLRSLIDGLEVFPDRMRENLNSSHGLVFSQPVLLALVSAGLTRDDAYRVVQRNAMQAWDERTSFRELLEADHEIQSLKRPVDFDAAFSLESSLVNIDRTFQALAGIQN
jgi:adenylosuccinate lyase